MSLSTWQGVELSKMCQAKEMGGWLRTSKCLGMSLVQKRKEAFPEWKSSQVRVKQQPTEFR